MCRNLELDGMVRGKSELSLRMLITERTLTFITKRAVSSFCR